MSEAKRNAGLDALREIRFHGRGGQGAVSAAALLALAAFDDGAEAQAFPKFGSERRGAPVEAYVRISTLPIRAHNQVYSPDAVVIQDSTLLHSEPVLQGLKEGGWVILNSEQPLSGDSTAMALRWVAVPATHIAEQLLGRPLPNTALLGALAAVTGWVGMKALEQAVASHLTSKGEEVVKANIEAVRAGYNAVTSQQGQAS